MNRVILATNCFNALLHFFGTVDNIFGQYLSMFPAGKYLTCPNLMNVGNKQRDHFD